MIELSTKLNKTSKISEDLIQLRHLRGDSVFMSDPDGNKIEIKTTDDGTKIVFTKDEIGKSLAIEERTNGTKVYHISSDCAGLPSSHEVRSDNTEVVYFYNTTGNLQHFVELKVNGDRVSTILSGNGSIFSVEQKQIGGVVFQGWVCEKDLPKEGMVWLHPDGEVSRHGDKDVVSELLKRFSKFLDGVVVEAR